jgi:oxidase EvaA
MVDIYKRINDYKMFYSYETRLVPLLSLKEWEFVDNAFRHKEKYPFEVIFCRLNIEGREVTRWNQPLFASLGVATFGLLCCINEGKYDVLIQIKPEIGCFDAVELGPSVQEEYGNEHKRDSVADYFFELLEKNEKKLLDVILSEEGGRFYHEQNRNVIMIVDKNSIKYDPDRYVWVSLGTLNAMTQINNCLNIQLRNLLMLLSMHSNKD